MDTSFDNNDDVVLRDLISNLIKQIYSIIIFEKKRSIFQFNLCSFVIAHHHTPKKTYEKGKEEEMNNFGFWL